MPRDQKTGAPIHPSLDLNTLVDGKLLPPNHPSWVNQPEPEIDANIREKGQYILPTPMDKKERSSESQPVSTIGPFAIAKSRQSDREPKHYLGNGSYGKVKLCQHRDGSWYAVKIIKTTLVSEHTALDDCLYPYREAFMLNKRGMVKGFYFSRHARTVKLYLIQDLIEGKTITDAIPFLKSLTVTEKLDEILKVVTEINKLHKMGILHKDLGGKNIMRRESGDYVIIDFGQSVIVSTNNDESLNEIYDMFENLMSALLYNASSQISLLMAQYCSTQTTSKKLTASNFLAVVTYAFETFKKSLTPVHVEQSNATQNKVTFSQNKQITPASTSTSTSTSTNDGMSDKYKPFF